MNAAIGRAFELLHALRENRHDIRLHQASELDGFLSALFWADLISIAQFSDLRSLAVSAFSRSGEPYPCSMNAGPVIPSWVAFKRAKQPPKPLAVPVSEPVQLQPVPPLRELRLLCLLVPSRVSKTEFTPGRFIPVHTVRRLPPYASVSGRWNHDPDWRGVAANLNYLSCGDGLYLRETSAAAPAASVLVRLQQRRQTGAVCADSRTVRTGVAG